jgi:MscS family membrane protein
MGQTMLWRRIALVGAMVAGIHPLAAQGLRLGGARESEAPSDGQAEVVDSASPRASVAAFLSAAREGDFTLAATWVDVSGRAFAGREAEIARRLKAVLDARLWLDLERISPVAVGDTIDGLPANREHLGTITIARGAPHPIRLARVTAAGRVRWIFSANTIAAVDTLYATLPDRWIRDRLPAVLLGAGPFDVLWWQWIALLLLLPLAALIGWLLAPPTQALLGRVVGRTSTTLDDRIVTAARGPVVLLWGALASRLLLRWVALAAPAEAFVHGLQQALVVAAIFWLALRSVGVLQDALPLSHWATRHPALRSLIPLGARIARLVIFLFGVLAVLASFGYPVATILAGLGIGGIAVALGAQKSLEHFFGSVSIGVDQPFRVGDFVEVDDTMGTVEAIGLRSSRIRTLNRTIVTIPNGRLAEAKAENFGERDRIRLHTMIGVEYGTTSETMKRVRDGIEALLRSHPLMHKEAVVVRFSAFGTSSLDFEIMCWISTADFDLFRVVREELLLGIMQVVESNGARFAFPTQTVWVKQTADGRRQTAGDHAV